LEILAKAYGFRVEWTTKGNTEIGLSQRVKNAENIKVDKGQIKLLISLHNNAAGDGTQ
jgi:N-acetylmuramoyl-L-alanine amidase